MNVTERDPKDIMRVAFGFFGAQALLTATKLDLFTALGDGRQTATCIGDRLRLHPRPLLDFLDALVALGFLQREGDGAGAVYENTPDALEFLDRRSPRYLGGILVMAQERMYRSWADLETALRTGEPQSEIRGTGEALFPRLYDDPTGLSRFVAAMEGGQRLAFPRFAERFDFSRFATLCDVGGASGELSIAVARAHAHMSCTTFDLPAVAPLARQRVAEAGLEDRVQIAAGDFFRDPLPRADVITMSTVLHDWNLEKKMLLIQKAYDALPQGGAFVVIEYLIDDARRKNAFGLLMSLHMLVEFGDGFDYTASDFARWCRSVRFRDVQVIRLHGPMSAVVAYK
jgi:hypothetical protein